MDGDLGAMDDVDMRDANNPSSPSTDTVQMNAGVIDPTESTNPTTATTTASPSETTFTTTSTTASTATTASATPPTATATPYGFSPYADILFWMHTHYIGMMHKKCDILVGHMRAKQQQG